MIYLDNAATTAPSRAAAEAFAKASEAFGNPSSTHFAGVEAARLLKASRETVAKTLGAKPSEIIFTPSGTFSNNAAVLGAARARKRRGKHIIIGDSEHPSVENAARRLESEGFEVTRIPTAGGRIDPELAARAVREDTVLASFMLVNNETGALYDIPAISRAMRFAKRDIVIHCDAVQAYLKTRFSAASLGADLISVSAHKIHAFKGCGALYVRSGLLPEPLVFGGGQESGYAPGTEPVQLICAFAAAADDMYSHLSENAARVKELYEKCEKLIAGAGCKVNVPAATAHSVLSVTVSGIKSEVMLNFLSSNGICVSAGSACSSHAKTNRVLTAFGLSEKDADCTVRISFSAYNTALEIEELAKAIKEGIDSLAKIK